MHQQRPEFKVSRLCQVLAVSRSGYYEWLDRSPSTHVEAAQQVQDKVQRCFAQGRGTYGTRRMKHLLRRRACRAAVAGSGACWLRQAYVAKRGANSKRRRPQARPRRWLQTSSIGNLLCKAPIRSTLGILPIFLRAKAGCTSLSYWSCAHGRSLDGRWPTICGQSW